MKTCYICNRAGYIAKEYTYKKTYFNCSGRHHANICSKNDDNSRKDNIDQNPKKGDNSNQVAVNSTSTETILLNAASVNGINTRNRKTETSRILLDTGSQRSYITTRLDQRLKLEPTAIETL